MHLWLYPPRIVTSHSSGVRSWFLWQLPIRGGAFGERLNLIDRCCYAFLWVSDTVEAQFVPVLWRRRLLLEARVHTLIICTTNTDVIVLPVVWVCLILVPQSDVGCGVTNSSGCCEELSAARRHCAHRCASSSFGPSSFNTSFQLGALTILMWLQMNTDSATCPHGALTKAFH